MSEKYLFKISFVVKRKCQDIILQMADKNSQAYHLDECLIPRQSNNSLPESEKVIRLVLVSFGPTHEE